MSGHLANAQLSILEGCCKDWSAVNVDVRFFRRPIFAYLFACLSRLSSGGSLWLRQQWPMGNIIAVHPGQDGKVRVATVKAAGKIFKEPFVKLVLLLQEKDKENNSVLVGGMSESSV